jgi:uncharacterized protein YcbK (DUF882 family)
MALNRHDIQGVKLTKDFWLIEFVEGKAMPPEAIKMNYEQLPIYLLPRIGVIAMDLQILRDKAKQVFGDKLKGIQVNCGARVKKWELLQGRSGDSQHCELWAADITPICAEEDFNEIFEWMYDYLNLHHKGGLGYYPERKFLHLDKRMGNARW